LGSATGSGLGAPPERRGPREDGGKPGAWRAGSGGCEERMRDWAGRAGSSALAHGPCAAVDMSVVRWRTAGQLPAGGAAGGWAKRARLRRRAAEWLASADRSPCDVRFDVASIHRGVEVHVVEDAF